MRALVLTVFLVSCSATDVAMSPTPTSRAVEPSATAAVSVAPSVAPSATTTVAAVTPLADGTRIIRVPDCHPKDVGNYQVECQVLGIVGDRDVAAVALRRYANGAYISESRAIDLGTGAMFTIRQAATTFASVEEIRDDLAILSETGDTR